METCNLLNTFVKKETTIHSADFNELFNMLLYTDETDRIEIKEAAHNLGKSFLETVSALSNEPDLGGGYILLGVSRNKEGQEPRYIVTGVSNPDSIQQQIATQCSQCFNIPIRPTIKVIPHAQGTMILVHIPEAEVHTKPIFIKSKSIERGCFRRIGSTDQICTREDLDYIYQLRTKRKYDTYQVEDATLDDFDPRAIEFYRYRRKEIKADAAELRYNDEDLLRALKAITTERGATLPTIGGMLLFGSQKALRRLFPMTNGIDYLLVEGREWVSDPARRFTSLEMCEPLITGIPNMLYKMMQDVPQIFAMEPDGLHRKDNPLIPRIVMREALVNAVMHKDYHSASPIQIIKYANRIEFRNQGYSLKPADQLGLPGSMPRNEILSTVFRDIEYAEGKGTGISTMRDEMRKANLSVPLIQSDRSSNLFVLSLLPHHLFTKQDIEWLSYYKSFNLSDEEARTLIVTREKGEMTNADYRTIHCVDTLTASSHLRKLRDYGLIEQKGRGSATYYVPTIELLAPDLKTLHVGKSDDSASSVSSVYELLSKELHDEINSLGKRTDPMAVKQTIKKICSIRPYKVNELAVLFKRNPVHFRNRYLLPMVESGDLILAFPNRPKHSQQVYKTKI